MISLMKKSPKEIIQLYQRYAKFHTLVLGVDPIDEVIPYLRKVRKAKRKNSQIRETETAILKRYRRRPRQSMDT